MMITAFLGSRALSTPRVNITAALSIKASSLKPLRESQLRMSPTFAEPFVLLLVLLGSMNPVLADESREHTVRCAEIAFSLSVETGNQAEFANWVDPEARFIGGTVSRGSAEVVEAWSGFFKDGGAKIVWRPQYTEVLTSGDLALSRGPYRLSWIDDDGTAQEEWGFFNSTWRRNSKGEWKVLFDAGDATKSPPASETKALIEAPFDDCGF